MSKITIRHNIRDNFTMVTNDFARDPHVSPRAAKVYLYLMSHSEGWETSAERIHKVLGMGLSTVKEALKDLEKLGYLQRGQERNADGTMSGSSYELFSEPQTEGRKTDHGATSENDTNVQVSTGVWKTDGGKTDGGNPTPIRRPSFKKNNLQEEQDKTPLTPQGGTTGNAGDQIEIIDAVPVEEKPAGKKRKTEGHYIPEGFFPSDRSIQLVKDNYPNITDDFLRREHLKFVDHWIASAHHTARKKDWDAAWRTWMYKAMDYNPPRVTNQNQQSSFANMSMDEVRAMAGGQQ